MDKIGHDEPGIKQEFIGFYRFLATDKMPVVDYQKALMLKNAGLEWNPKPGDSYYLPDDENRYVLKQQAQVDLQAVYAPAVDDMLQQIKEHGYGHQIYNRSDGEWLVEIFNLYTVNFGVDKHGFTGQTPEHVVAEALIWVLSVKEL